MSMAEVMAALGDDTRRRILLLLRGGQRSAGEIAQALDMPPPALSYHLGKLKKAGLIYETRRRNYVLYDLNLTVLDEAILWLHDLKGESRT